MALSTKYTIKDTFEIGAAKTWATTDVDLVADSIRIANHGYKTGDPVGLSTTGAVPTGLTALTTAYYIIQVDGSKVALATSRANAFAGTKVNLTAVGSGVGTMQKGALGITLGKIIPSNHVIVNAAYKVVTTGASVGPAASVDAGTLAISVEGANDIISAVSIVTGTTWDDTDAMIQAIPDIATVGDYKTTTADRQITFTTGVETWTAGKLHVYLDVMPTLD